MKKASAPQKTTTPRRAAAGSLKVKAVKTAKPAKRAKAPTNRLLQLVVRALDEKKAGDVRIYHVGRLSSITDYLVIGTATSDPHLRALRVELEKVIDAEKVKILGIDTSQGSGWTVVDAFDVMVHLFTNENREKYRLDLLWKDADEVPVSGLL
ncbi:MAG: ribosome silencing factor [Opitutae bacterium]|nr:ribosome silencing factor [Opitutae bacterium]